MGVASLCTLVQRFRQLLSHALRADVNPLSPALRSGPTAGSGASLQKQIPSNQGRSEHDHIRSFVLAAGAEWFDVVHLQKQLPMLTRLGKATHLAADISKAYRQQVRHAKTWLTGRGIPALSVSYADLVHRPDEALPPLAAFLGVPEKLAAMRAVIDPSLHRARGGAEFVAQLA